VAPQTRGVPRTEPACVADQWYETIRVSQTIADPASGTPRELMPRIGGRCHRVGADMCSSRRSYAARICAARSMFPPCTSGAVRDTAMRLSFRRHMFQKDCRRDQDAATEAAEARTPSPCRSVVWIGADFGQRYPRPLVATRGVAAFARLRRVALSIRRRVDRAAPTRTDGMRDRDNVSNSARLPSSSDAHVGHRRSRTGCLIEWSAIGVPQ
jgi:hypothetical protein